MTITAIQAPIRAAEYVRMSTDGQQFSIANQQEAIKRYAQQRGYKIVRTYADEAKSGLYIHGRSGFIQLLYDVQHKKADFEIVLILDVSRWGRFQDTDESAHYEFLCRQANIRIEYCAEPFENDGSLLSTMFKNLKRGMAAEFSRDLAVKIHAGQARMTREGYVHGGAATYGLRRMLVGPDGKPKCILAAGERKNIKSDRVVLVPGPEEELQTVRNIFHWYAYDRMTQRMIVQRLNIEGASHSLGKWTIDRVASVLRNERYVGYITYGRRRSRLLSGKPNRGRINVPEEEWVRGSMNFPEIVPRKDFELVQLLRARWVKVERNREMLLAQVKAVLRERGELSIRVLDETPGAPKRDLLRHYFKGMREVYSLLGYTRPEPNKLRNFDLNDHLSRVVKDLRRGLIDILGSKYRSVRWMRERRYISVNEDALRIGLGAARFLPFRQQSRPAWVFKSDRGKGVDAMVLIRMDLENRLPLDYFVLPQSFKGNVHISIFGDRPRYDGYQCSDLNEVARHLEAHSTAIKVRLVGHVD